MSQQQRPKTTVTIYEEPDHRLLEMVKREIADERGCEPSEIGNIELFRELALYRLDNPKGVQIRLNGTSDTVLQALNQTDESDPADALAEIATDAMRLRERDGALSNGAKYTGDSA